MVSSLTIAVYLHLYKKGKKHISYLKHKQQKCVQNSATSSFIYSGKGG